MTSQKIDQLRTLVAPIADLTGASSVLSWDQETMMPSGGTEARAHQAGTLAAIIHERYTSRLLGDLLAEAAAEVEQDSRDGRIVAALRRQYDQRTKLPADLVVRQTELSSRAREAWKEARATGTFDTFAPFLAGQFALARETADHLGYDSDPYDALLDRFEPGTSYEWIAGRFQALKPELQTLIERIRAARDQDPEHDRVAGIVRRAVSPERQTGFGRVMAEAVGYDFHHGRLDLSAHPFTSGSSYLDVRLTTRVDPDFAPSCLFSCLHEAGHGIHGQRLDPDLYRVPIRYGLAIAESQSRFYENMLGRSRAFWERHFASLTEHMGEFASVSVDEWYRAINAVTPSLIRVEADEVTYGMHIMLRFELEHALVNGAISTDDLPAEWNARMKGYLGVVPENDSQGVLQDIHWSQGGIGYFPDYLLGSMLSAQLWDAVEQEIPTAATQVESGDLDAINTWMATKVQRHGGLYTFAEIARHATKRDFGAESYLAYLRRKYGEIYHL